MTSLPGPSLQTLLRPHIGDRMHIRPTSRGNSSDVTALVEGEQGKFFLKAVRNRPGGRRESLVREALINPYLHPICPAVRWQADNDEWLVLGFEVIDARSSDFTPGSGDLPAIIDILNQIAALELPDVARDWLETRWDHFAADPAHAEFFRGNTLLHTDINPDNLLIGADRTWAIDWAWPTRGAAFIDPACLVIQLIAAGHSAQSAESWAVRCTTWAKADTQAIDAFAAATLNMYTTRAGRYPEANWLKAVATAAQEWADHRGITEPESRP